MARIEITDEVGVVQIAGEAAISGGSPTTYVQDADPGAVGAGILWLATADPGHGIPANVRPLFVRDAANAGWDELGLVHRDNMGNVLGFVTVSDGMTAIERRTAADVYAAGVLLGDNGRVAIQTDNGASSGTTLFDGGSAAVGHAEIGFYGSTPIAQPTVTGALSAVVDPAVAAILTSLIAALESVAGMGLVVDGTT